MILPNQLTTLRILLTPIFLFLFLSENSELKQLSLLIFTIASITDWYDGWLARKFNYITAWGKFMDPLADKILTSAAFFAFVSTGVLELWMVLIVVFRDIFVTGLRLFAEWKNKIFTTSRLAKIKTAIQMTFIFYILIVYTLKENGFIKSNFSDLIEILTNSYFIFFSMLMITLFTLITGLIYINQNKMMIFQLFFNSGKKD